MKRIIGVVVFCFVIGVFKVNAEEGKPYVGISLSKGEYSHDYLSEEFSPVGLIGKIGYKINKNFAVEGRFGTGITDDEKTYESVELDNIFGVYGKGILNINEKINFVGLIGFTRVEGTYTYSLPYFGSNSNTDDESGLSFGVGFDFAMTDKLSVGIEYIQYLSKSKVDVSGIELGITKYF